MEKTYTPGDRMTAAMQYVAKHPGCVKLHCAEWVGPQQSRKYGYEIVDRCIRRGYIEVKDGKYAHVNYLYLTGKGEEFLSE